MPFIPHTPEDIALMLAQLNEPSIDNLFDEIPAGLRCGELSSIPEGLNEQALNRLVAQRFENDKNRLCFIGAGSYQHHIPAVVWQIVSRGENLTAYTPYQAEASQGNLQLLFEFQTMIASLTGMDVSNASMYDGASALAEAVLMAVRIKRSQKNRILVAGSLHPRYRKTVQTLVSAQGITLIDIDWDEDTGCIQLENFERAYDSDVAAVVIQQPNFFGQLEEVDAITTWARSKEFLVIACCNPTSLALLKEPGCWGDKGVDIVCGEGQPLGIPVASGGPYMGFLCTRMEHVRNMPGRIVGQTVDTEGKIGYTLTLQAREQHIRRSKATSNICTNQGLLVTAATIYMSLLGPLGLKKVAAVSHQNTHILKDRISTISGVVVLFSEAFFHECVVRLPVNVNMLLTLLASEGIDAGYDLSTQDPRLKNCLLMNATEIHTDSDIDFFVDAVRKTIALLQTQKNRREGVEA